MKINKRYGHTAHTFSRLMLNIEPKPTEQSRSHPLCRVLLQIFLGVFFVFDQPSQLWVVLFKKLKFPFPKKMALKIFIIFCGFIEHSKPNNMILSIFPEKSLKLE